MMPKKQRYILHVTDESYSPRIEPKLRIDENILVFVIALMQFLKKENYSILRNACNQSFKVSIVIP
mgnify:CR=1 FL=1